MHRSTRARPRAPKGAYGIVGLLVFTLILPPSAMHAATARTDGVVASVEPSASGVAVVIGDDQQETETAGGTAVIPSTVRPGPVIRKTQAAEPTQPDDVRSSNTSFGTAPERPSLAPQTSAASTPAIAAAPSFAQKDFGGSASNMSQPTAGGGTAAAPASQGSATSADVAPPSSAPATDTVRWSEVPVIGSDDAGSLLQQSPDVQTVRNQRRSPVSFDPRVRGFKSGQIYTQGDGTWWTPVRADLDTMLSKIDPGLLEQVTVVPGPYGLRYGPGLAFLHVETAPTPRYDDGFQSHARTGITVHPNGGQLFGRATIYGGNDQWGFLFNHGNRIGNDYRAGDDSDIPASYHNANYWGQLGFDIDCDSRIEFRYGHLDQTDTQYAGQFFDIDALGTDSFAVTLLTDEGSHRRKIEAWYNETDYYGDTDNPGKRPFQSATDPRQQAFNVINRVEYALATSLGIAPGNVRFDGRSNGDLESSGFRGVMTYGDEEAVQWSYGADVRYVKQRIAEHFDITNTQTGQPAIPPIDTNQPESGLLDAGVFSEVAVPMNDWWNIKIGTRTDTVHTDTFEALRPNSSLAGSADDLNRHDTLYAFYITSDAALTQYADLRLGAGHAQRPPTLTERYADGVFLGIIQNGFSRVIGNPALDPERSWQVDMTLDLQRPLWRGRLSGYHAWVADYITYEGNLIAGPEGARLLVATNTDLATLTGFEIYNEVDLLPRVVGFGSISYIEGRDQQINAMLPGMYPLESTLGLRLVNNPDDPRRGLEFGARIVNDEDRIGRIRVRGLPDEPPVAVEEATPGFTVLYLRSYWNVSERMHIVAGIDNLGDLAYLEHLNLRLPADANAGIPELRVMSPGISPYFGLEWNF